MNIETQPKRRTKEERMSDGRDGRSNQIQEKREKKDDLMKDGAPFLLPANIKKNIHHDIHQ